MKKLLEKNQKKVRFLHLNFEYIILFFYNFIKLL